MVSSDRDQLLDMGFPPERVDRALKATKNAGLQPAMDWLLSHADDDLDETVDGSSSGTALASGSGTSSNIGQEQEEGEIKAGEETAQSLKCDDCQRLFRDAAMAERHAIKSGHVNFSESTTAIKPLTEEEKLEKLAELKERLAENRRLRLAQEKEEEKMKEKIRRKSAKEMTEARERLEEKEMEKALLLKKKEKEEEKAARAKIKAQIEQDKRDRAAKREASRKAMEKAAVQEAEAAAEAAKAPKPSKEYTEARLQFRQISGPSITHTFQATDTLQTVYDFVAEQVFEPFQLLTTYPRKVLDGDDREKTLKELDLCPSNVLMINK